MRRREVIGQIVLERQEPSGASWLKLEFFDSLNNNSCTCPIGKDEVMEFAVRQLLKTYLGGEWTKAKRDLADISREMKTIASDEGSCSVEVALVDLVVEGFGIIHDALVQWKVTNDARRG